MVPDPSALLLLKYGIPYHKILRNYIYGAILGHKLVHGAGGLHMLVLLKLLMLMFYFFVTFNVKSSVFSSF